MKDIFEKAFPKETERVDGLKILEASWLRQRQSWIVVWYKKENSQWIPIEMLVSP